MTDLTPEARTLYDDLTGVPTFLEVFALIAGLLIVVGFLAWGAHQIAPGLFDWLFEDARAEREARIAEARAEENAKTLAYIGVCGASDGVLVCGRALGHDDDHADWTRDTERPVPFRVGSLGHKSLDEIRREYGGGNDAA